MSFCTKGLPEVAESTASKSEGKLTHLGKCPFRAYEGCDKVLFPEPYPASKKVASVSEDEGYSWNNGFCDFAFGSAQNDKVGGKLRRLKIFGLNKPIKRERESSAVFKGY